MEYRPDGPFGKVARTLHNGKYNEYDKLKFLGSLNYGYFGLDLHTGDFADYHMTGEEYKAMVKSKYEALSDSIAKLDAPQAVKDLKMIKLQNEVLEAMAEYKYLLEHNYRHVHDAWREREIPSDSIPGKLSDHDLAEVATWFDINNPKLLMDNQNVGLMDWNALGVKGDLSKTMYTFLKKAALAKKTTLTEEDIQELKALSNPFFAEACVDMLEESQRALNQINERIRETPNVADEKIFDAIIAEHKGKVVMVDLWNTWCGPCRAAIKATEPLKDKELSDEEIVWIYIADESSDPQKYLEMIPNIRGIHYKLTRPQVEKIRERFNVDGIPYFILVDREGKATGRPDLRDHNKYIKAIKELL